MFLVLLSFKSLLKSLFIVVVFFLEFSYSLVNSVILSFIMVLLLSIFFVFFAHFYIELFTLKISLWQLFETYFGHQSMMCFPHTKPQINFFLNYILLSCTECLEDRTTQGMVLCCGYKHCPYLQTQKHRLTFLLVFSVFSFTFRDFTCAFLPNQNLFLCV